MTAIVPVIMPVIMTVIMTVIMPVIMPVLMIPTEVLLLKSHRILELLTQKQLSANHIVIKTRFYAVR